MLETLPQETTQLLIDICTTNSLLSFDEPEDVSAIAKQPNVPSYLSYLALNRAATVDPTAVASAPAPAVKVTKPSKRDSMQELSRTSTPPPSTPSNAPTIKPREIVKRPSPRVYFAHFVDHMEQFVTFLETVAIKRWAQTVDGSTPPPLAEDEAFTIDEAAEKRDQIAVWNTLLELYLSIPTKTAAEDKKVKDKALRLLQSESIPYDPTHALIVCSTRQFTAGLVLLWERLGMHEDVLRFWMDKDREAGAIAGEASRQVVHYLDLYGPKQPHLYPLVLRFLTSTPELLSRHSKDVEKVVEVIDEEKIMPPLAIVQVLSRNGVASVGLVRQWLMTKIREAREDIDMVELIVVSWHLHLLTDLFQDQQLTNSYRLETQAKLKQVDDLSDPEHPRVFHVTQCAQCHTQLELPSVHFMCNHSYHQRYDFACTRVPSLTTTLQLRRVRKRMSNLRTLSRCHSRNTDK